MSEREPVLFCNGYLSVTSGLFLILFEWTEDFKHAVSTSMWIQVVVLAKCLEINGTGKIRIIIGVCKIVMDI